MDPLGELSRLTGFCVFDQFTTHPVVKILSFVWISLFFSLLRTSSLAVISSFSSSRGSKMFLKLRRS